MDNYDQLIQEFNANPINYWERKAKQFKWFQNWTIPYDDTDPYHPKWFVGGTMNLCYECLDKNVQSGHSNATAFIFDDPVNHKISKITYSELLRKVSKLAGMFVNFGLKTGDHVLIYLPMMEEAVITLLACCRLGLVYFCMMGPFTEYAIADRINDFKPQAAVVVSAHHDENTVISTKDVFDTAVHLSGYNLSKCFVFQRDCFKPATMTARDVDIWKVLEHSEPHSYVPVEANSPCMIIYTSGTTGKPKGIVMSVRSVAMAVCQGEGKTLDLIENDVVWVASTFSWIAGQVAGVFMALISRATSLIYQGSVIHLKALDVYRLISTHGIKSSFISTGGFRAMRREDPEGKLAEPFKPFSIKKIITGGTAGDVPTLNWIKSTFETSVLQLYGLTEVGGPVTICDTSGGKTVDDQPLMSCGKIMPGWIVKILRDDLSEASTDEIGRIVVKAPFPPTMMSTIYDNDEKYIESYLKPIPGYFDLKDNGKFDHHGYLYVLNRHDTIFKAHGHRLSCTELEDVMMLHPDVAECVVITRVEHDDGLENEIPIGFFNTKNAVQRVSDDVADELHKLVHERIGEFLSFSKPIYVESFPRTLSGKISRGLVQEFVRNHYGKNLSDCCVDSSLSSIWKAIQK